MPRGGRGYLYHEERYDGPGQPFKVGVQEFDTLTCVHCNGVVILNPLRVRPRHHCWNCDAYVCDNEVCVTECNPFMRSVDLAVKHGGDQAYLLRGPRGEVLFDKARAERERPYRGLSLGEDNK